MNRTPSKVITLLNRIEEINSLPNVIDEFFEQNKLPSSAVFNINLALEEIVSNIILYGFPDDEQHSIILNFFLDSPSLTIEIIDDGTEFDPLARPDPDTTKPLEERQIGGLGIFFVKKFMNSVTYQRINSKNIMTITKDLYKNME